MNKAMINKKITPMTIVAVVEFITVFVLAVVFKVEFYNALPIMVSTLVMFMQANVNRYAFLVGSINSLIYTAAYFYMNLYGSVASALFFSFPFQIVTFINWNRHSHGGSTEIKRFTAKGRACMFSVMAGVWIVLYVILSSLGSSYIVLDNTVLVIGVVSTILCLLRYSEYSLFSLISSGVNVVMFGLMSANDITKIIWLIHSAYCMLCSAETFRKTRNGIK